MRQKRLKSYKKWMRIYKIDFGFREPYQTLIDADYLQDSVKYKMDLIKLLERILQGKVKPMITQCCIQKLYETKQQNVISIAKTYERRRCNHKDNPLLPEDCIYSIVNINGKNKHRYIVATQSIQIRAKLRNIPGVPLFYINRSVVILEPSSYSTIKAKQTLEQNKLGLKKEESEKILGTKRKLDNDDSSLPKKKRKGPKEPNPLSVKKKKIKLIQEKQISSNFSTNILSNHTTTLFKKTRRHSRGKSHKKLS
ncbi:hypothetical protein T552_01229 [Pneumocystis carinii B80]|uniref:U three protein 23 n=1 Tax=Pneumocystis carinii (strain B80) TaxID=1408658 RepID=A0A0W4ZLM2_PNEC8|nr:hypothetical protein T552_01229 [Pneumocystis carinii B80]KTW29274.1 hypothetical protein T552_01229 [Pneumocystis carinii B80]